MPIIKKRQDLGLWLKLLKRVGRAYGITDELAAYRVHSASISSNKLSAASYTWRLYRDVERLNMAQAGYYFFHYAFNGIFRSKT